METSGPLLLCVDTGIPRLSLKAEALSQPTFTVLFQVLSSVQVLYPALVTFFRFTHSIFCSSCHERLRASTFLHLTVSEGGGPGPQLAALGQFPVLVLTLDCPALPAGVTSPGAGHPGPRHPLRPWGRGGRTWSCGLPRGQDEWGGGGCGGASGGSRRGGDGGLLVRVKRR